MKKRILVAPLDWGLGHATRCIPIIKELCSQGLEVLIAADNGPLALLRKEFTNLETIELKGHVVKYPKNGNMTQKMLIESPGLLWGIWQEHRQLKTIIEKHRINAVISDSRFGLWSQKIPCIFVSHQLNIQTRFGKKLVNKLNTYFISKYNMIWILDREGKNSLSGILINSFLAQPHEFIGPISRFNNTNKRKETETYDFIAILSGPEPQRSIFEQLIREQSATITSKKGIIIQGLTNKNKRIKLDNGTEVISHLKSEELLQKINCSKVVIARSGYSTIMDLEAIGKKAILVPTPGQTEQEYLANYHHSKGHFFMMNQHNFNLKKALELAQQVSGIQPTSEKNQLKQAVETLIKKLL